MKEGCFMAGSSLKLTFASIALMFAIAGCQGGGSTPATVQSAQPAARSLGDGLIAHSIEQDLRSFKRSWEEGLLTKEEYQQARTHVLNGVAQQVKNELYNSRYTPERMHEEIVYIARMKKDGELSEEEYELARKAFVNGLVLQQ
jgi:hypothetical protein